jgi:hypothetical protein
MVILPVIGIITVEVALKETKERGLPNVTN